MNISEQVKELRELARKIKRMGTTEELKSYKVIVEADDAIESLSAKLSVANGSGWIACEDRLPENRKDVLVFWGGGNISVGYFVYGGSGGWFFNYGFDYKGNSKMLYEPFAWQPLPEPYRP